MQSTWEREIGGAPYDSQQNFRSELIRGWAGVVSKWENRDFLGGPVVENPHGNAGDMGSISGQGGN